MEYRFVRDANGFLMQVPIVEAIPDPEVLEEWEEDIEEEVVKTVAKKPVKPKIVVKGK